MRILIAALATGIAMAGSAYADETWRWPSGTIVYEADLGNTAIFTVPFGEETFRVYLPGLAGNFQNRGLHTGFFLADGPNDCGAVLSGPDGVQSRDWGKVVLTFDGPAFPTGWSALLGTCFEEPGLFVRADLP